MDRSRFRGVFSLLLTPFLDTLAIDWGAYERYTSWQLGFEPDGLFAVCGSSEMKWLSLDERLRLAKVAVGLAGTRPVVATANLEPDLGSHPEELRRMADTGVAGVVLVPPPGLGENQDRLGDYFARLADAAPCPVVLYEWPLVKPCLLDARIYERLVRDHGVAGVKDTTCTMEGITAKIRIRGPSTVFQANAPFLAESVQAGAGGMMAITTTAAADLALRFWRASAGEEAPGEAARNHAQLVLLDCALVRGDAYPASAKHLANLRCARMGLACRNPVTLSPEGRKAVEVWLEQSDLRGG